MGSGSDSDDSDVALSAYAQVMSSQGEILPALLHPDSCRVMPFSGSFSGVPCRAASS